MSHELLQRHRAVLGVDVPLFYEEPLHIVRGEGVWLFDVGGRRYLDLYNNVPCVGHSNPRVVKAMCDQAATLNVHSRYLHLGVVEYAERLVALHAPGLESVVFTCTGTEANEVAVMMARAATGARGIICSDAGYHGNSTEISQCTGPSVGGDGEIRSITTPQLFRPLDPRLDESDLCDLHIRQLEDEIARLQSDGVGFAGLLMCSILANEGLPTVPVGFMARAAEVVQRAGGLLIADEVQAGFARSGNWWGYQTSEFEPDIVSLGKPMGNGIPLAGVVAGHELVSTFRRTHRYFNTFAASPLQAAVGDAVVDEIEEKGLVEQVAEVGQRLLTGLRELQAGCPAMGEVRGHGLFIGVDWVVPGSTEPDVPGAVLVVEAMKERGFLMGKAGQGRNVLKIRPPLVLDHDQADLVLAAFAEVVGG